MAIGASSLSSTSGTAGIDNTAVGTASGSNVTSGHHNTLIGYHAGQSGSDSNYVTTLGAFALALANGAVSIGIDHTGTPATATNQDDFQLGTSNHVPVFPNNQTGSGTTTLGTNSPGSGTPHGWLKIRDGSNTIGYIPYWT